MAQFSHKRKTAQSYVEKKKTLAWTQEIWETFEVFDALRSDYDYDDETMQAAYVADSVFVLECMVGCYECGFEQFPKQVDGKFSGIAVGLGVQMVEATHRTLGIKTKQNYNDHCSRHQRWNVAIHSGIVESNDRMNVKTDDDSRREGAKQNLKLEDYTPNNSEFSMGEECFKQLVKKRQPQQTTTTKRKRQQQTRQHVTKKRSD